ncbi:MAG TPA: ATP-binding protein [Myxococcota bacterium]|nr:ATP-binding protein [Myxococcota bacterium]
MSRYTVLDRWLIFGLLPVIFLGLGLHVRQVLRTGLAMPPVFATPPGDDGYPRVGGHPLEVETGGTGLEVGDRLIRVGEVDLRGRGYMGFMAIALEQAGLGLRAPLVYERDGQRVETTLEMRRMAIPWLRVPFLTGVALSMLLLLIRRPDTPLLQRGCIAMGLLVIGESIFMGGPRWQTFTSLSLFLVGLTISFPLVTHWLGEFPGSETLSRALPGLGWLAAASGFIWALPKLAYFLPAPIHSARIPAVNSGFEAVSALMLILPVTWNYFHASAVAKRQIKWLAYGCWTAALAMVPALAAPVFVPDWRWFEETLGLAGLIGAAIPIGFLISVIAYNLFDVDRLISAVASYTLLLVGLFAAALALVPRIAAALASATNLDAGTTQLFLSVLLAALVVPVNRRLRPRLDHIFFPERRALESGVDALLDEIARTPDESHLLEATTRGLHELFHAVRAAGYASRGHGFAAQVACGAAPANLPLLGADHPLSSVLGERGSPLVVSPHAAGGARKAPPALGGAFLAQLDASLLLPLHRGDALAAFVALGPKNSGDVYTASDLALLSAVTRAAGRQLDRLRAADELARERERRAEEAQRRREAEDAHFARSRHLAAASHDLRQPLHALGLFADALEKRVADEESRALVARMRSSVAALREMFDALIDLSRLEQDALRPDVAALDLDLLLERLADEAEPAARAKGLALRREPCGLRVKSDPVLLGRILQNLLVNAVRYTAVGEVALRAREVGEDIEITVSDTGPGIPAERRDAIFQEFVRFEGDDSVQGLGLGLAIVDRLARLLAHPVSLESEPGRGSDVRVTVPAAAPEPARAPARAAEAAPQAPRAALAGRRILVIDDDLDILLGMRALLEEWGAEAVLAASGEEALEALDPEAAPDALIVDYRLGDARGTDVIEALRRRAARRIPALVVTGSRSQALHDDLARHDLPHLTKPLAPSRLRAALGELLRRAY